jgi:hypothetical protein
VQALILAGGGWLAAALLLYGVSPAFLTHPHRHFSALRFTLGAIVLPAIAVASVLLISGRTELACAVGIPAGGLLWLGAAWLQPALATDEALTERERQEREQLAPTFATTAAVWGGSALALAVTTFALVIAISG